MRLIWLAISGAVLCFCCWAAPAFADAQASPAPAPSPAPSPSASPKPSPTPGLGFHYSADGFASFVDEAYGGPGLSPPEGAAFASGSPLSPMTPYDVFYSAPEIPGLGGVGQFSLHAAFSSRSLDATALLGLATVSGSVQSNAYWTENLLPSLNPHVGSQALPYSVVFAQHAGQDDGNATRLSLVSGSIGTHDGALNLRAGWFDLVQTDRYVFVQPPLTNVTPSIGMQTPESLTNGQPSLDSWPSPPPGLPLNGLDLVAHRGIATLELTNAALPALPGTSARLTLGSLVFDHGEGTRWSAQFLHLSTGGDIISTTMLFGANPMLLTGLQGPLPSSDLGGQQQTIVGLRGAFHATSWLDATIEVGRAWYNAQHVLEPGTQAPGGFYHLGFAHPFGRASVSADVYRWDPRYATAILPYGVPENVWSVAWAWPGVWLKSNYQLTDNTTVGTNRQGFRLHYTIDKGPIEVHAAYAQFHQIDPSVLSDIHQVGFVDGFFLPQFDGAGTLGVQHAYNIWIGWHPAICDATLDYVNDTQHRDFMPTHPEDAVSYQSPQMVLTFSRGFGKRAVAALGYARYAMRGSWGFGASTNVDYRQGIGFIGAQFAESSHATALVQLRRSSFTGLPSQPGGPSPDFSGTTLIVEQRYRL